MDLDRFLKGLIRLRRGSTQYGQAPHKPIFLLTMLHLLDSGHISENRFYVDVILVSTFHEYWDLLAPEGFQEDFTQPFYYMQNDKIDGQGFWFLIPKAGLSITSHIKNINTLAEIVDHAALSDSFFHVLANKVNREAIRAMLLHTYFPNAKNFNSGVKQNKVSYLESID
jgi:putative restriction endonuclease